MSKAFAAAIFFSVAITPVFAQQLDAAAPSTEPMPGFRDGDAGARKLRYRCSGEGKPTVLIEAGGETSFETLFSWESEHNFRPGWLTVIAGIEKTTRVCVYDRAGLGRSDKAPLPRTSADVAIDLRALLRNEKISTPVVCVGQSFGGSNCRIFASHYPRLVAGMVLVDASDADFWARMKLAPPDLTKSVEWVDLEANSSLLRDAKGIGDKPLIVLTANPAVGDPMIPEALQKDASRLHQELQRELLDLSTNSLQVVASKAGHNIQHDEPQLVADVVLELVNRARARGAQSQLQVHCGTINLDHSSISGRSRTRKAIACVREAQKSGRTLSVSQGFSVFPDFFVHNNIVLGPHGEKILMQVSVSNDGNTDFVGRCAVLEILDNGNLEIDGCEPDEALRAQLKR